MKRFAALTMIFGLLAVIQAPLLAQDYAAAPAGDWNEPENHTIVVDRLMMYHDYGEYDREIQVVVDAARDYLSAVVNSAPQSDRLAAVFDIDETSLSNYPTMAECGFCSYAEQLKYYGNAIDPAIQPVLALYNFAKSKGFAVFFVTGRQEPLRPQTIANLTKAGYSGWADLIMQPKGATEPAGVFKPKDRKSIEDKGYRIVLNIGDQASDLSGCCAERGFKLPNPFYLVK
ncbi:MAG TPA: HAD family acid phosphatase [Candidatus Aquilonibacter sp.]|nr:HAD family acid phosphatase [Candidatus Aquilonibacter sp.]